MESPGLRRSFRATAIMAVTTARRWLVFGYAWWRRPPRRRRWRVRRFLAALQILANRLAIASQLASDGSNAQSYSFQCMYHKHLILCFHMLGSLDSLGIQQAPKHTGKINFLTRTPASGGACQTLKPVNFKLALVGTLPLIVTSPKAHLPALHPDQFVVAETSEGLLREADQAAHQAQCIHFGGSSGSLPDGITWKTTTSLRNRSCGPSPQMKFRKRSSVPRRRFQHFELYLNYIRDIPLVHTDYTRRKPARTVLRRACLDCRRSPNSYRQPRSVIVQRRNSIVGDTKVFPFVIAKIHLTSKLRLHFLSSTQNIRFEFLTCNILYRV